MDQNGSFWSTLVSRMLKPGSEQGHFDQNGRLDHFGPFWSSTLSDSTAATPYVRLFFRNTLASDSLQKLGEELSGSEKLGLASKVLQNLWGSVWGFFSRFSTMERFHRALLQNPKGSAEFWGGFGSPGPSFEDWPSSSQKHIVTGVVWRVSRDRGVISGSGHYTPARNDYIHQILFSQFISTFQLHKHTIFLESISWKLHYTYSQGRKNSININFLARISRGHSWPLRPNAQGSKVSPPHPGHRKTHFLVRTSTIFGADVHDPKGSRKTLYKKSLRWFFGP